MNKIQIVERKYSGKKNSIKKRQWKKIGIEKIKILEKKQRQSKKYVVEKIENVKKEEEIVE